MTETNLTEMRAEFVRHLVLHGCTQTEAARRAGYVNPSQRAWELVRDPHVMEAIREEQLRVIDGDLANVALKTLRDVMTDESSPASARVSAAKVALDIGGYRQRETSTDRKPLDEMTTAELEGFIRDGQTALVAQAPIARPN